jgi:hypothetical protein
MCCGKAANQIPVDLLWLTVKLARQGEPTHHRRITDLYQRIIARSLPAR